jgi:S1-C subfamily serine protease
MSRIVLIGLALVQPDLVGSEEFSKTVQLNAVTATVRLCNQTRGGLGTGVNLGKKGKYTYILTTRHFARKGDRVEVSTFSEKSYPGPEEVYASGEVVAESDNIRDLALVRLSTKGELPGALRLCPPNQAPAQKGKSRALAVGCTSGKSPTPLVAVVLGKKRISRSAGGEAAYFWQIEKEHPEGRSGGPLVDGQGHLLGILSGTSHGKSYFVYLDEIAWFLRQHPGE